MVQNLMVYSKLANVATTVDTLLIISLTIKATKCETYVDFCLVLLLAM